MQQLIIGIRFQKTGKIYHFDASDHGDLQVGDYTVVDTSRGRQLGEVVQMLSDPQPPAEGNWKRILRRATPRDLVLNLIARVDGTLDPAAILQQYPSIAPCKKVIKRG